MRRSRVRTYFAVLSLAALTGCSGMGGHMTDSAGSDAVPTAAPPIVSDRFLLESDQQLVGEIQVVEARHEDTFVDIARAYNLGFDELVDANPNVDPWLPGEGTRIVLPTRFILPDAPREGIVINLASKRLFYYPAPDEHGARVVVTHPIGIGEMGTATPEGATEVTSKARDPVWYVPATIRREYAAEGTPLPPKVMPGPDNPLGSHVLVLGMPSYLIHGTNRPAGVGMRVSHGCVRLFPENIAYLYEEVPVGAPVTIVNQPRLLARQDGRLYLEAHQPLSDDPRDWDALFPRLLERELGELPNGAGVTDAVRTETLLTEALGVPLPIMADSEDPAEIFTAATVVNNLVELPSLLAETLAQETGAR